MAAVVSLDTPKLGFGLMRLPHLGESREDPIDVEQVKKMVDIFLERGFTYFDTAWAYPGSEEAIKQALVERYPRDSFTLTTKNAAWIEAKSEEEAKQQFYTSLERTGAGYFDLYLLHNLGVERIKYFDNWHMWDFISDLKKQGLVKHIGFSFHDKHEFLDKILTEHPEIEFVQLQINYADWENPTVESRKNYETVLKHGKGVIIMEPVKGGTLANLPEPVAKVFDETGSKASYPSWAIRFAASLPGVVTVLSGMSNIAQMEDNTSFMQDFKPLSDDERAVIAKAQATLDAIPHIPCTDCRYCMEGCPENIPIPAIFSAYNNYLLYGNADDAKHSYMFETRATGKASDCRECRQCEDACPQSLPITDYLKKASELFD